MYAKPLVRYLSLVILLWGLAMFLGVRLGIETVPPVPSPAPLVEPARSRPNILLIVADDLGYSDLGSYGGEIDTPNLDALAMAGTRFSQFHAASACSPTRAMLLTGVDHHIVGLGAFSALTRTSNQRGAAGYEAHLNWRAASLGEVFLNAGYHTYISGKWHLGYGAHTSPPAHGFQRSFVLADAGSGHFSELSVIPTRRRAEFRKDGHRTSLPEGFYSSDFFVDEMIRYIEADRPTDRPFLAYLAFTAPHFPLQAKAATVAKYERTYLEGYEQLARRRHDRLLELGLLSHRNTPDPYPLDDAPAWDRLSDEQKAYESRRMAIYAAMVDDLDTATGRLIDYLKSIGEFDNTIIAFLSDNGAEGHRVEVAGVPLADLIRIRTLFGVPCCDNSYENIGSLDSHIELGPQWASATIGPYRYYKGFPTQGGLLVPAFISGPGIDGPELYSGFVSVKDILPTLMDAAGIPDHRTSFRGRQAVSMEGVSMLPMLTGKSLAVHGDAHRMGWESFGKYAVRVGDWKLLRLPEPYGDGRWELFNLADDPAETRNLATTEPARLARMIGQWEQYRQEANVILPEGALYRY